MDRETIDKLLIALDSNYIKALQEQCQKDRKLLEEFVSRVIPIIAVSKKMQAVGGNTYHTVDMSNETFKKLNNIYKKSKKHLKQYYLI